jgi:uncharacterized protein with PIN domain
MSRLSKRLRRLDIIGVGCPVCGSGTSPVEYIVTWDHEQADTPESERCPECNRQLVFVVRWGGS